MPEGYDLEMISVAKEEFNFASWKQETIAKFRESGFQEPEEHFERMRESQAIAWHPEKQSTPKYFVMSVMPREVLRNTMFDTDWAKYPTCPHCGYQHEDVWEWDFGPGFEGELENVECASCGGIFHVARHTIVRYETKLI